MHSGGGQKLKWSKIYIEAPEHEAKIVFQNRFGRNPDRVTCTCCGPDYSISEEVSLEQASAYHRNCDYTYFRPDGSECDQDEAWKSGKGLVKGYTEGYVERLTKDNYGTRQYIPLKDYISSGDCHVIYAKDIKASEREGELHEEGYVWRD
jgi:hypothetical protein